MFQLAFLTWGASTTLANTSVFQTCHDSHLDAVPASNPRNCPQHKRTTAECSRNKKVSHAYPNTPAVQNQPVTSENAVTQGSMAPSRQLLKQVWSIMLA